MDYYKEALIDKYADFSGRARRAEFWQFYIIHFLVVIGLAFTSSIITPRIYIPAMVGYSLFALVPCLAVTVRRLHDIEKSGWWILIKMIPVAGGLIFLIFLATEGTYGPNYYGEDPKDEDYELE
ncbi:MAG: DUF805 domain-containing protein [Saprospiraceae bacterium]|nr:DUF805 domain-containing protein [Saprospiraceae bacterium]